MRSPTFILISLVIDGAFFLSRRDALKLRPRAIYRVSTQLSMYVCFIALAISVLGGHFHYSIGVGIYALHVTNRNYRINLINLINLIIASHFDVTLFFAKESFFFSKALVSVTFIWQIEEILLNFSNFWSISIIIISPKFEFNRAIENYEDRFHFRFLHFLSCVSIQEVIHFRILFFENRSRAALMGKIQRIFSWNLMFHFSLRKILEYY